MLSQIQLMIWGSKGQKIIYERTDMKISEGIKLKGRPAEIIDSSRDDLPEFFKERGFKVGVEVGVFQGDYTEILAKGGFKVYGVDPWLIYNDYGKTNGQGWYNRLYARALRKIKPYSNVELLKMTSMEAVQKFEDESLDFVYIDGNHRFKYVAEDIFEWSKKIKQGGVLCGHDYAFFKHRYFAGGCQVHEIVDAFALSFELDFWVLGRRKPIPGEKRDRMRSWMFIKNWENY